MLLQGPLLDEYEDEEVPEKPHRVVSSAKCCEITGPHGLSLLQSAASAQHCSFLKPNIYQKEFLIYNLCGVF